MSDIVMCVCCVCVVSDSHVKTYYTKNFSILLQTYYKLTTSLLQVYYKHITYYLLPLTANTLTTCFIFNLFQSWGFGNFDFTTNFQIDNIPVCLVKHQSIMLMDEMIDDLLGPEDYYLVYKPLSG